MDNHNNQTSTENNSTAAASSTPADSSNSTLAAQRVFGVKPTPLASGEHPLETSWTIWFDKKPHRGFHQTEQSYKEGMTSIGSFNTLEGFWAYYSRLARPHKMLVDTNYHVFRAGTFPSWEQMPRGGCWILRVNKATGLSNRLWENLLFSAIGEGFGEPDVVGVELSIRVKEALLSVWVRENRNPKVGEIWTSMLEQEDEPATELARKSAKNGGNSPFILEYKAHSHSIQDHSTYKNTQKAYAHAAQRAAQTQTSPQRNANMSVNGANGNGREDDQKQKNTVEAAVVVDSSSSSSSSANANVDGSTTLGTQTD